MSLRQFFKFSANRKAKVYTSNVTTAPPYNLPGRDAERPPDESESAESTTASTHNLNLPGRDPERRLPDETKSSRSDTLDDANYIYYRMYVEDGAIPSKTPAAPDNPFLGRIKATSISPPHTVKNVRYSIARVEDIKDPTKTTLFLTAYCRSPMCDTDKVILNRNGLGSTPQEPLAFVAWISDFEQRALESEVAVDPDTTPLDLEDRYLYYLLYANDFEKPSKVAIDPEKPSLGRIRADSVAPPHSLAAIKRCISRAERTPALAHADIFLDITRDTPLKELERHISIPGLPLDCPGLSPKKPMAITLDPMLPDGRYVIKNRAADIYWYAYYGRSAHDYGLKKVYFKKTTLDFKFWKTDFITRWQWDITHDTNGNISMKSCADKSSPCIGVTVDRDSESAEIEWSSEVPVPWRLIRVDSKFYYLTTNVNYVSWDSDSESQVAAALPSFQVSNCWALMTTLKKGDQWQMWEFIRT